MFARAPAAGRGTIVDREGRMADIAVVRWARDVPVTACITGCSLKPVAAESLGRGLDQ